MKNYIQPGKTVKIVAAGTVLSGAVQLIGPDPGGLVGIACHNALVNEDLEVQVEGCFEVTKKTTDVVAVGDPLYWDLSATEFTKTATANTLAGIAITAAGNGVTTCVIRLNGSAEGA